MVQATNFHALSFYNDFGLMAEWLMSLQAPSYTLARIMDMYEPFRCEGPSVPH